MLCLLGARKGAAEALGMWGIRAQQGLGAKAQNAASELSPALTLRC